MSISDQLKAALPAPPVKTAGFSGEHSTLMKLKELPLPPSVPALPMGYRFVGRPIDSGTCPASWMALSTLVRGDRWSLPIRGGWEVATGGDSIFAAPDSEVEPLEAAPIAPKHGLRWLVEGHEYHECFDTAEEAYEAANEQAEENPKAFFWVWELRAKVIGEVRVNTETF